MIVQQVVEYRVTPKADKEADDRLCDDAVCALLLLSLFLFLFLTFQSWAIFFRLSLQSYSISLRLRIDNFDVPLPHLRFLLDLFVDAVVDSLLG